MSATKDNGQVVIQCDECKEHLDAEGTFEEVNLTRREMGWMAFKDKSDRWLHTCYDCQESLSGFR